MLFKAISPNAYLCLMLAIVVGCDSKTNLAGVPNAPRWIATRNRAIEELLTEWHGPHWWIAESYPLPFQHLDKHLTPQEIQDAPKVTEGATESDVMVLRFNYEILKKGEEPIKCVCFMWTKGERILHSIDGK